MQPDIQKQIEELDRKLDEIYVSVEKARKYFFWSMVVTLVVFVLPLIALIFIIPSFLNDYMSTIQTLGA